MAEPHSALAEQFDDMAQQEEAATLGMWTFLATEILFFGGLFTAYLLIWYTVARTRRHGPKAATTATSC